MLPFLVPVLFTFYTQDVLKFKFKIRVPKVKVNLGFRQGVAIARLLFNVVLETVIRRSKIETGGTIFDKCSQIMVYDDDDDDDVVIMGI
jgi:hypothetical protein